MIKKLTSLVAISLVLFSCNSTKSVQNNTVSSLEGNWELNYILGSTTPFKTLYPNKIPNIAFEVASNRVSGNNGCNTYTGEFKAEGNTINFLENIATTRMMCMKGQEGEQAFMTALKKINRYAVSSDGKTLTLIVGDIATMRFVRLSN